MILGRFSFLIDLKHLFCLLASGVSNSRQDLLSNCPPFFFSFKNSGDIPQKMFLIFPPKNLENTGCLKYACARLFFFGRAVSNIRLKWRNFPAKKLRKNTGAQNTHALIFFFFKKVCLRFYILLLFYFYVVIK